MAEIFSTPSSHIQIYTLQKKVMIKRPTQPSGVVCWGVPPPTRWSRQSANDRYKDHLDGKLTVPLVNNSVKDPHFLAKKQQKMAFFWKNWILGPKRPPRGASPTWNMYLYGGYLFQAFWTKKIQPGQQEGPKTAKMGYFWRYQNTPILAVFGPSCRPGWIFLVQKGWKRCPPYRYMFMLDSHL